MACFTVCTTDIERHTEIHERPRNWWGVMGGKYLVYIVGFGGGFCNSVKQYWNYEIKCTFALADS